MYTDNLTLRPIGIKVIIATFTFIFKNQIKSIYMSLFIKIIFILDRSLFNVILLTLYSYITLKFKNFKSVG